MLRHTGKKRTYKHNLRLASLLSFIAGLVNVTGLLSVQTLTTNVTGHFAFFAEELIGEHFNTACVFLIYIFSFLLGAFTANSIAEVLIRTRPRISHAVPMFIEMIILCFIGTLSLPEAAFHHTTQVIACFLLFAMGLQNALVTKVSGSVVRTTHLTGLFTDLGIELSQLLFFRNRFELEKLKKSIYLRMAIITCFFLGGIISGYLYQYWQLKTVWLASGCLMVALFYDNLRYEFYRLKRGIRT